MLWRVFARITMVTWAWLSHLQALPYQSFNELPTPPILVQSAEETSSAHYTNVTVIFTTTDPVRVLWTIDDGFAPEDVNNGTIIQTVERNDISFFTGYSTISIPVSLTFDLLRLHIMNWNQSNQVHLEFRLSHNADDMRLDIEQFQMFIPRETEIGISSRGRSRFHVLVNTTSTPFSFGMLQAEMVSIGGKANSEVVHSSAYSFLPDFRMNPIRIKKIIHQNGEYHADVMLNSPYLHQSGGIISILAACTIRSSLISSMYIKQALHVHSKPGYDPLPKNSVGFVDIATPLNIAVKPYRKSLIRCKAVGNPIPNIHLYKKSKTTNELELYATPNYKTSLPFEVTAVFQFMNITTETEGDYVCKGSNDLTFALDKHIISLDNT